MTLRQPSIKTLKKYGLDLIDWVKLSASYPFSVCAICEKLPTTGRLVIDHEHVKGWKKMPPSVRRKYVRGLLCWRCNYHFAGKGMNCDRAMNLFHYLKRYRDARVFS